jgi:hypothetical protein
MTFCLTVQRMMKVCGGHRSMAPVILNLLIKWRKKNIQLHVQADLPSEVFTR